MKWPYKHPTKGTCIEKCPMYGKCHCGCEQASKIAPKNDSADGRVRGEPNVFINDHYRWAQWRPRRPADCHPERENHIRGLCSTCYWRAWKRKARDTNAIDEWERSRYRRFLELTAEGLEIAPALRRLERDVPSEVVEASAVS